MKVNTFYSHNLKKRMDIVNASGDFIVRIKYYGFYISLYVVDDQFVEVYHNIHNNEIEEVEILCPLDDRLHIYAVQVNLSDLYKSQ